MFSCALKLLVVLVKRAACGRRGSGECRKLENDECDSSTDSPFSFLHMPNFRSASLSWRKTRSAAPAISLCIASSFSSPGPSVCGL